MEYSKIGMTKEQINAMHLFDLDQFNSDRRYFMHTQDFQLEEFEEMNSDESDNALMKFYLEHLSCSIEDSHNNSRYWWVEEIDNPGLAAQIKKLSHDDLELITMYVFDGYKQKDLAVLFGINQKNICKKIKRITDFLKIGV